MHVYSLPRSEVVRRLRARTEGLSLDPSSGNIRDCLNHEARTVESAPGETLGEARRLAQRNLKHLTLRRNLTLLPGIALAAGGLTFGLLDPSWYALGATAAGVALVASSVEPHHKLDPARSRLHTIERAARELSQPPPGPPEALVNPLSSAAPEHRKDELLAVLEATQQHLDSHMHQPGRWAAWLRVGYDLERARETPGETLADMKTALNQQAERSSRLTRYYQVATGVGMTATAAAIFLPSPWGWVAGGAALLASSALLYKGIREGMTASSNQKFITSLDEWGDQIAQLKALTLEAATREVTQLASNPTGAPLEVAQGMLTVGGVRIPVRRGGGPPRYPPGEE